MRGKVLMISTLSILEEAKGQSSDGQSFTISYENSEVKVFISCRKQKTRDVVCVGKITSQTMRQDFADA
jgi:hypothetical protein